MRAVPSQSSLMEFRWELSGIVIENSEDRGGGGESDVGNRTCIVGESPNNQIPIGQTSSSKA